MLVFFFFIESTNEKNNIFLYRLFVFLRFSSIIDLYKEVGELEHALNTEFDFSPEDGLPLMVLREKLDQQLVSMREMYKEKRDAIEECLLEQEPLVDELGEEMRVLSLEPLATDAEVSDFKLYLKELREERVRRLDQIDILQNNIRIISTEIEMDLNGTLQKSYVFPHFNPPYFSPQ